MIKFLCEKYIEKHKKYSVFNVFWCTHVLNKNLPGQFWILKIEHEMCYKSHLASIFSNRAFFNSRLHAAIFLKAIYNFVMEILKALLPVNSYFCLPRYEVQLYLPRYKRLENIPSQGLDIDQILLKLNTEGPLTALSLQIMLLICFYQVGYWNES